MHLCELNPENAVCLQETSYGIMPEEALQGMIAESCAGMHEGRFFRVYVLKEGKEYPGVISLYENEDGSISLGPEIKAGFQRKGYATKAMEIAMITAWKMGYTHAASEVRMDNAPSVALNRKLGFREVKNYKNRRGRDAIWFSCPIQPLVESEAEK